ncbi:MAG: SAM-dependent methyltransferase [Zetaproteobacteria bacterium]|nr:SAM-dependent methyltransferase [Zetaproteobacteria bacterium]
MSATTYSCRRPFVRDSVPRPEREAFAIPFPRDQGKPIDIEIGCGTGHHSIVYARHHPERILIAIEHTHERFGKFKKQADRAGLPNLIPVHANAISWIAHLVPAGAVERFFLLYPNPYPKDRQRNKRWHAMPFMSCLLDCLRPGGTVTLATNELFYAAEAQEYMRACWELDCIQYLELQGARESVAHCRTLFEYKYLARGETCYDQVWVKPSV